MKASEITVVLTEMTDKPWFSWPAHYAARDHSVYWGSDFVIHMYESTTEDELRTAIQDYIDNRMRQR